MVKGGYARALVHGLMVVGLALPGSGGVARAEVTLFENLGTLHHRDHDQRQTSLKNFSIKGSGWSMPSITRRRLRPSPRPPVSIPMRPCPIGVWR
jgi:hypothetical protein